MSCVANSMRHRPESSLWCNLRSSLWTAIQTSICISGKCSPSIIHSSCTCTLSRRFNKSSAPWSVSKSEGFIAASPTCSLTTDMTCSNSWIIAHLSLMITQWRFVSMPSVASAYTSLLPTTVPIKCSQFSNAKLWSIGYWVSRIVTFHPFYQSPSSSL